MCVGVCLSRCVESGTITEHTGSVADEMMNEATEVDADVIEQRKVLVSFHLSDQTDSINELHEHRAERVGHWTDHIGRTTYG